MSSTRAFLTEGVQQSDQEAQKSLREQGPERNTGPFGPVRLYYSFRSPLAYSLPCTASGGCTWQGHVPVSGRSPRHTTMKEKDTMERLRTENNTEYEGELSNILCSTPFLPPIGRGGGGPLSPLRGGWKRVYCKGPVFGGVLK